MNEWILFAIYVICLGITETIFVTVSKAKSKKRETKLEKKCLVWKLYLKEYKEESNDISVDLYEKVKSLLKKQEIKEIEHGKCLLEADLGTLGIIPIIFGLVQVLINLISKVLIYGLLIGVLPSENVRYETTTDIMSKIIELILVVLWIWIIYPLIKAYEKERYFLEMLNIVLEEYKKQVTDSKNEKTINTERSIATIEGNLRQLRKDMQALNNKMNPLKGGKVFEMHFTMDKGKK